MVRAAERHRADLIVVGHSGHSSVWGRFLGSTAEKTGHHAPCSVLIVR
jgi:nucleotide-binding universal stress UspA family protein